MKNRKIKSNAFRYADSFEGKTGADYVRSMIAPQDEKMYEWLNERVRVGRFGTKQMTQFFEYALENPTPEFYAYVMRKMLKHFGISNWDFQINFEPYTHAGYLQNEAQAAKERLKVESDNLNREQLEYSIKRWEDFQDSLERYTRFCECFLHDEDWSVEQELEIGQKRRNYEKEVYRRDKIKSYHDMFPSEEELKFDASEDQQAFDAWKREAPNHFITMLEERFKKENTKQLLDEAEGRVAVSFHQSQDSVYYERFQK